MDQRPAPLTPPDSDISDFGYMPLDVVRFRNSDIVAFEDADAVLAAILLWGVAWHSTPAGSLTNDDRSLAQAAGFGRAKKEWLKVKKGALRGFFECSDGRLYHPVVAEKANEAWQAKLRRQWNTVCAAIRKRNERAKDQTPEECPTFDAWLVARDAQSGHAGLRPVSHVTDTNVAPDTPPKNAPRDRDRERDRDRDRDIPTDRTSTKPQDRNPPIPENLARVMTAANMIAPPSDAGLLREWLALPTCNMDQDIIPIVTKVAAQVLERTGRAPFKLKLFDAAIREKLAEDAAWVERSKRDIAYRKRLDEEQEAEKARQKLLDEQERAYRAAHATIQ